MFRAVPGTTCGKQFDYTSGGFQRATHMIYVRTPASFTGCRIVDEGDRLLHAPGFLSSDFGAGFWDLTAGGAERGRAPRHLVDASLAPVWEANHVWLIFVLVMLWTAFPTRSRRRCPTR